MRDHELLNKLIELIFESDSINDLQQRLWKVLDEDDNPETEG